MSAANGPFKPGMQVRKSWCLLSSNWVGLDKRGGQQFSKKKFKTEIILTSLQKKEITKI
jgi:hypothetical protein